jgi:hypothetical protein
MISLQTIDGNVCIGNTLSTFNANFAAIANEFTSVDTSFTNLEPRIAAAWGLYDISGSSMLKQYNITVATKEDVGQFLFQFANNLPNVDYAVILSQSTAASALPAAAFTVGHTHTKTVSSFKVTWLDDTEPVDPEFLEFMVLASNIS